MYKSVALKQLQDGDDNEEVEEEKITTATALPNNTDADHIMEEINRNMVSE